MVDLLPLGDSVQHYAAKVKRLYLNGQLVYSSDSRGASRGGGSSRSSSSLSSLSGERDLYAIFDSGTSGCIIQVSLRVLSKWAMDILPALATRR
jgi:hypothetical protein